MATKGSLGGTPHWDNPSPTDGVTFVRVSDLPKSDEGKFARKVLDQFDRTSFSVEFLARFLVVSGTEHMRSRLLAFAKSLIHYLAFQNGITPGGATKEAARLQKKIDSRS